RATDGVASRKGTTEPGQETLVSAVQFRQATPCPGASARSKHATGFPGSKRTAAGAAHPAAASTAESVRAAAAYPRPVARSAVLRVISPEHKQRADKVC